jgi:hypothetical protein
MGSVLALGGIDGVSLGALLDQVDHGPDHQRALLVRIESAAEEIVERVIDLFADTALRLWPLWFTDISFAECRSDTLGRAAARIIARQAAETIDGLSHPWAEAAVALALNGRKPRVTGVAPAVELAQLARAEPGRIGVDFGAGRAVPRPCSGACLGVDRAECTRCRGRNIPPTAGERAALGSASLFRSTNRAGARGFAARPKGARRRPPDSLARPVARHAASAQRYRAAARNRPVARLRVTGRASRLGTKALQNTCTALGTDE